ncbi:MAG TPA: MASE1 domain-containing protein [Arenimonas sp.]|uniref:MASE1 domain-containing protein n=1 Tax=Arenimonas sp. TaxID=1872635 RepID=UPI002C7AECF1|nr:MASE1 domain-containing protein [Arenimonas sp.]HMB57729.1 MASE1 domain-containing protein [Arenimonas sp.]
MIPDAPSATASRDWRALGRWLLAALLYGLAWQILARVSHVLWFLPAGLRLGALWLTPTRRWGWLAAGEWIGLALMSVWRGDPLLTPVFFALEVLPFLIYAVLVLLVRGSSEQARIDTPARMLLLVATGLASAALVAPVLSHYLSGGVGLARGSLAGTFAFLYGDFTGQLVMAPALILLFRPDLRRPLQRTLWRDLGLLALFSLSVFVLLQQRADLAPYLLMLGFAPIFYVSFRQGWEGAALAIALIGLGIELLGRLHALPVELSALQLALAVIGGGGLVLGAASSELRRSHENLGARHRELGQANQDLARFASDLRDVSQRLVRLEEQGQRELAGELDYELGAAIHALGTRISLAFRDVRDQQTLRLLESVREQVREMQDSLRRVLRQLRPQALDTHGLREAIGFGPLREMLEDAGIVFETMFYGRIEALSDDARTAVYRICQAAVREATRMDAVHRVLLKLDVMPGQIQHLQIELLIEIEVSPFVDFPVEANALPAISDRVLAQRGHYQVEPLTPGVRHLIRFEDELPGLA